MHPLKRIAKLLAIDPWYVLHGYPHGAKQPPATMAADRRYLEAEGVLDLLAAGETGELRANFADLAFLHRMVVERNPRRVLEFGCGFSTLVIAHALAANAARRGAQPGGTGARLYGVDSSERWIANTLAKLPPALRGFATITHSRVEVAEIQGQLCHLYATLPDVVPDFVYLDGPDPATVEGSLRGLSFGNPERTVLAGDMIALESTLLPGFFMIVDGRTNNARFLQRMLRRRYRVRWLRRRDVTTFELRERKLGYRNVFGYER